MGCARTYCVVLTDLVKFGTIPQQFCMFKRGPVNRYLLSLLSLFGVLFWLLFSYLPPSFVALPQFELHSIWSGRLLQALAVVTLVIFLLIQVRILHATLRLREVAQRSPMANGRSLRWATEVFWTALPLVMTVGLVLLSIPAWRKLAP